jgi:hypothetical protein
VVLAGVTVPLGVAVTSGLGPDAGPADPSRIATSRSPEPTPAPAPTAAPPPAPAPVDPGPDGTFPLTLEGVARGAAPQVGYVLNEERMLVSPEGRADLPVAYPQIVRYRDGWLALRAAREGGFENVVLDADMNVLDVTPGGDGLLPNRDHTRVLHSQRDVDVPGRTVVVDAPRESGSEPDAVSWEAPRDSTVRPVGYLGEQTVVYQAGYDEDAVVEMGIYDDGPVTVPLEGFVRAVSTSEAAGLVAGQLSWSPAAGSCYGVMDPARSTTAMVWQTCDYSLHAFSPDGRYVIAGPPDHDMWGPSGLTVLEVGSWEPAVEFTPERDVVGQVAQAVWEDKDTVLALLVENDDMGIVRAELSGGLELTTDVYPSTDMTLRLWFADPPRS